MVFRQSIAVAETVGAEDPSVGAVACMGNEFGTRGAGARRQFFDGGIELLAQFTEVRGELGVGDRQVGVGAREFNVCLSEILN